jgi:hypothetical protein
VTTATVPKNGTTDHDMQAAEAALIYKAPKGPAKAGTLAIPELDIRTAVFRIVGTSPLITHAWSEKAKKQMRDKQQGKAAEGKEPKNPEAEMEGATYRLPTGEPAIPTLAFKNAAVDAATQLSGITKVFLRGAFHTVGDLVEIQYERVVMREDMVRVGMGTADIRYRPEYHGWTVDLVVRFNARSITLEQLTHLLRVAGFSTGVGEWRPQRNGINGTFDVASAGEMR